MRSLSYPVLEVGVRDAGTGDDCVPDPLTGGDRQAITKSGPRLHEGRSLPVIAIDAIHRRSDFGVRLTACF